MLARLTIACLALLAAGMARALAADVDVDSKIDAVTIYPDAAAVTRVATIDVPAGTTILVFKGLPLNLDPSSLRAAGTAAGRLAIGAVESRLTAPEARPDSTADARLTQLRSEREGWQVILDALAAKRAMMLHFAQAGPEKLSPEAKPLPVADWPAAWEAIGTALAKVGDELRSARAKARDLDDAVKALEAARVRGPAKSSPARQVTVALEAPAPVTGTLALTYRISGAAWHPLYDARLRTSDGAPALEFVRRAAISQHTGENWNEVAVTVSTVRADRGTSAPEMRTKKIAFVEPPPMVGMARAPHHRAMTTAAAPSPPVAAAAAPKIALPLQAAEEPTADLEADAFQASFKLPGRVDLASDGSTRTVTISSRHLTPDLAVKAVPALDTTAYLQSHFVNDEQAPLLPGKVDLHRDGTYVGSSQLGFVAPGDGLDLGFGADDRVKVVRVPVRRRENEPTWFGQTKIETREFKITVRNLHDAPVKVVLVDQIPVSENTAINVEMLPATTPPTEKIVADRRGLMSWTYDYAPRAVRDIRLAYRMKWPADRDVSFSDIP